MKKRTPRWVYVWDSDEQEWQRRLLIEIAEDGGYICVVSKYEKEYADGYGYKTFKWKHMREIANFKLFRQKFFLKDL